MLCYILLHHLPVRSHYPTGPRRASTCGRSSSFTVAKGGRPRTNGSREFSHSSRTLSTIRGSRSPPDCRSPRASVEFFTQAIAEIGQVQSLLICAQHAPGIVEVAGSGAHPSKPRRELARYQERRPVAQCVRPTLPVGQAAISRPLLFRSGSNYTPLGRVNRIPESDTPLCTRARYRMARRRRQGPFTS